jgi:hypothetical protein
MHSGKKEPFFTNTSPSKEAFAQCFFNNSLPKELVFIVWFFIVSLKTNQSGMSL